MQFFAEGCCNILGKTDLGPIQPIPYLLYGPNTEQPPLRLPVQPQLVFNQIAEPDSHRVALERCAALCRALGVPVINDPNRVLAGTRDSLSQTLADIDGLRVPRVIRCAPTSPEDVVMIARREDLPFPWLLRTMGEHSGKHMVLVRSTEDLHGLNIFPFDGREFYLVEYVDYAGEQGHFQKHRLAIVDGDIHFRHNMFDKHWIVHVRTALPFMLRENPGLDMLQRLRDLRRDLLPAIRPTIEEIKRRLGLDIFGIDFAMLPDGSMLLFEANANMNLLSNSLPPINAVTEEICESVRGMIRQRQVNMEIA